MSFDIEEMVTAILRHGKAGDLADLLLGDSSFRVSESIDLNSDAERDAYAMTIKHLQFLDRYGDNPGPVQDGGRLHFSYPEYFEAWMKLGCPGVTRDDLLSYMEGNSV